MMELREILTLLKKHGIRLKKKLSQVLLINEFFLRHIAREARKLLGREVLELGAGPGNLTKYLLDEGLEVVAVEIDGRFAPILRELQRVYPSLHPVIADCIPLLETPLIPRYVVGNVPYHVSSDILVAIARSRTQAALITLQKEVAERLVAKPGCSAYGRLSVLMQLVFDVEQRLVIPPSAFMPQPDVYSTTVLLVRKRAYDELLAELENVTRCLFSYRNKLLRKALRKCFGEVWCEIWNHLSEVDESTRVYQLEPRKFLEITCIVVELRRRGKFVSTT